MCILSPTADFTALSPDPDPQQPSGAWGTQAGTQNAECRAARSVPEAIWEVMPGLLSEHFGLSPSLTKVKILGGELSPSTDLYRTAV